MSKKRHKPSAATLALQQAKRNHEKWLLKHGVHPTQLRSPKKQRLDRKTAKSDVGHFNGVSAEYQRGLSHTVVPAGAQCSLWEKLRVSEETPETLRAIQEKASRCLPAYNKGGVQYLGTDSQALMDAGKKNPTER